MCKRREWRPRKGVTRVVAGKIEIEFRDHNKLGEESIDPRKMHSIADIGGVDEFGYEE